MYDLSIIGGGIVGLSVGWALTRRYPNKKIVLLEKEQHWGYHQTGHNSGEIHSGIYYAPGSLKARLCRAGNRALVDFCRQHGVPHKICGIVVVASSPSEIPQLDSLWDRAQLNGIEIVRLNRDQLNDIEPHCVGLAALSVPSTGIVDYQRVAETLASLMEKAGANLYLNTELKAVSVASDSIWIDCASSSFESRFLINCAGLQSDRVATLMGIRTGLRIVPVRGEYYRLRKDKQHLVKTLVYPLPNLRYPFLGVHFNRQINGEVRVGPNAVLSLQREGYDTNAFHFREAMELCQSPAFWKFAYSNWREGGKEFLRSFSKRLFLRRVQRLIPDVQATDLVGIHTGIRAQAIREEDGQAVDDFVVVSGPRSLHICNAPSPAATSSIPIGMMIVDRLEELGVV
ncbi:MAG: L-2-hydroxyglutarate oxidase [Nitrospirota bacterium]|nr:L-2-hydroxyglutarate oxidase [Nitrospirota bacterium]